MRMSELWAETHNSFSKEQYEELMKREADEARECLRDQFAMAALTGLLSNPKLADTALKKGPRWFDEVAYQYADGMLNAREAK
jgi:hypothetical protein